jgi:DNA-binding XRE family transcriptional regulator
MNRNFSLQKGPTAHQSATQLRASYGLTQAWLAMFLGIPRSTLSMEEKDRAELPLGTSRRLLPFWQGLTAPEGPAPEPSAMPTAVRQAAARPLLVQRQLIVEYEAQSLGREQKRRVRLRHARLRHARLRQQTLPALLAALAPPPADEWPRRLLGHWTADPGVARLAPARARL